MGERCENKQCGIVLDFPSSREILEKKRTCPACGKSQRVEKSILYVVETLEERLEAVYERLEALEAQASITPRPTPQPIPPRTFSPPPVDLFGIDAPTIALKDLL